ncbi:MAG: branched-chain amino acid ABC transporter permease/ATP-binding protein [Actinomycetota bacterium]
MSGTALVASWITPQIVVSGAVSGLVFGLLAMGIVLVHRSTRVINFAVGNMGVPGAALFALMVINWGWPFWLALVVSITIGAAIGAVTEVVVIKRLFHRSRVVLLIATVGIAEFWRAVVVLTFPDVDGSQRTFPVAIGRDWDDVLGVRIEGSDLQILVVVPLVALGLGLMMNRTTLGKAVTASADNPDLSRLSGINPHVVSTIVWTIAGLLATVSMMLLSGGQAATGIENLGPFTLTNALAAAVIARFGSFPRVMLAGVAIGVVRNVLDFNFLDDPGLSTLAVFIAVVVALAWQRGRTDDDGLLSFAPRLRPIPARLEHVWWIRNLAALTTLPLLALVVLVAWQNESIFAFVNDVQGIWVAPDRIRPSQFFVWSSIVATAICVASLTIITGWSGQVSLAQMAFAGIGALTAAALARGAELDIGFGSYRLIDLEFVAWPAIPAIVAAAVITAILAALTGITALRVRGLMLAVSTFAFAIAAESYLYERPFLSGGERSVVFDRGWLFGWDLSDQRSFFFFSLGCLVLTFVVIGRLRRSGVGRSIIAVRDNPDAAAAYTVSPVRMKLTAFALAGGIAGLGGGLLGNAARQIQYSESLFQVEDSLRLVNMVVIGGLGSVLGPLLGALWTLGLPAFFPDSDFISLLSSSVGFLIVLMYLPGGFIQVVHRVRDLVIERADRRFGVDPAPSAIEPPTWIRRVDHRDERDRAGAGTDAGRSDASTALTVRDVEVRFGGVRAVDGASIDVAAEQIVGLIGTNGAGKSTLMNAIGGYVPATGSIRLGDREISSLAPPARARAGLGRTFQAATLFPGLTVRETVQVALESRHRSSVMRSALLLDGRIERRRRSEADELIGFLGLGRYGDSFISDLSTGTRRIVELAGLLALGARVLCLDEPTAGVAQRETEAFGPLIVDIRREMRCSMVVIEHDMPLIMSISDRVYCLEAGSVIAQGAPAEVRDDPKVVASYLGTDGRAIERSDA